MVAEPLATPVTVTVVPDTDTVATLVLLDTAETVPVPVRVTVIVSDGVLIVRAIELLFRLEVPAAFPIVQDTDFAAVVPSAHLYLDPGVNVTLNVPAFVELCVPAIVILLESYPFQVGD